MTRIYLSYLMVSLFSVLGGPLLAKGPFIHGLYRGGEHPDEPKVEFEIRFAKFNLPGTTTRIQSCNFHEGCKRPDTLSAMNLASQAVENYLREIVFTRIDYKKNRSWEIEYAYISSEGKVVPMAVVSVPEDTTGTDAPAKINVKTRHPALEFSMDRISD